MTKFANSKFATNIKQGEFMRKFFILFSLLFYLAFFYSNDLDVHAQTTLIIGDGDANIDGRIDFSDLRTILGNYTAAVSSLTDPLNQYNDGNAKINSFDFAVVVGKMIAQVSITPTPLPSPSTTGSWWKPTSAQPISWHWQLSEIFSYPRDVIENVTVYDIDGEQSSASTVASLHALGPNIKVICYFGAGVYENYRSDASSFPSSVIGSTDTGWNGSYWLDIRQTGILLPIMENRIKTWCKDKGFDAVEPDETEVWSNNSGFPITKAQNNTYNQLIASLAHKYNLAVALKGNTTEAGDLYSYFDFSINEQCWEYNECNNMLSFIQENKAVFNIEYNVNPNCTQANSMHMNSAKRDLNLVGPTNSSYKISLCEPYGKMTW